MGTLGVFGCALGCTLGCVLCANGVIAAVEKDGPRECRGTRLPVTRGVVVGSILVLFISGVIGPGTLFFVGIAPEASDRGGEGGDVSTVEISDVAGGGVANEGEVVDVADVDASDIGDGGRKLSVDNGLIVRERSRSIICSA